MRKMWVKKESIYKKPFYKQKLRLTFCGVIVVSFVYISYQIIYMAQLQSDSSNKRIISPSQESASVERWIPSRDIERTVIRGIRSVDSHFYLPSERGTFRCISSGHEISFAKVNDDYCDCVSDGSDEPSTNACSLGIFYCETPQVHISGKTYNHVIPSSRINDGICDCCDGSDEWMPTRRKHPCPTRCS
uniref:Putative glucosidase 2 subunit beta isoform x2 n=1 Tax=Nyssomyia neivai TaxID=330878 RepID=A0A1L8E1A5_9DIPT